MDIFLKPRHVRGFLFPSVHRGVWGTPPVVRGAGISRASAPSICSLRHLVDAGHACHLARDATLDHPKGLAAERQSTLRFGCARSDNRVTEAAIRGFWKAYRGYMGI